MKKQNFGVILFILNFLKLLQIFKIPDQLNVFLAVINTDFRYTKKRFKAYVYNDVTPRTLLDRYLRSNRVLLSKI